MINTDFIKRKLKPFKKIFLDKDFQKRSIYTKYLVKKAVNDKLIFYEAYHGGSMTGNPYAVFKYLLDDPRFDDYRHVWAIKNPADIHEEYKKRHNVDFVKYQSIQYVKYLATAKYLINDTTFPYYFHKRKEQMYANIWHGTPLKTMGLDIKNRKHTDHKNIQRNFLFSNYLVSPNQFTAEKLLRSHDIHSIYNGIVLDTGYPRVDLMFSADQNQLRKKLSIQPNKKVILYAPTWRGVQGNEQNQNERLFQDISFMQKNISDDYIILIKSHYYVHTFFKIQGIDHLLVPNCIDTNELLSIVDLLITDYSSIFFEYLPTKNPIIYYAYDANEYLENRGTYMPLHELPGPLCMTIAEVVENIKHIDGVIENYQDRYNSFLTKFCYHDDGKATLRFVNTFFHKQPSENVLDVQTDKRKILMYAGGFLNNGITASAINLLNSIDYNQFDVTLISLDNHNEDKWRNINKVNNNVHFIYRTGNWNASWFDWFRHALLLKKGVHSTFMDKVVPTQLYKREMERMTGLSQFDIGIDFSGYNPFWTSMIAFGDFKKKSIFLHADMGMEVCKKVKNQYPHRKNLNVIFSLYNFFDKVLSVSRLTHEENMKSLRNIVKNHKEKMDFVINTIDYASILSLKEKENFQYEFAMENIVTSMQQQKKESLPNEKTINFITIGRLGPEKDHEKLINAFSRIASKHQLVSLYIVGEGALKDDLQDLVKKLKLEDKVFFTGQLRNPYILLDQCDCFVLSSNHEGQPMVLLEALVLRKPIIVTDIPGSRSVIEGGYGLIVENTIEGLVEGMNQFINGTILSEKDFDYERYREDALSMFYEKVCHINH